jgi:UDP-2,3-diacylglucosamine hydrolase
MKTVVFSDAHLTVADSGRERMAQLVVFLRWIDPKQVDRVVILGDLFDFWFEYRHVIFSGYFDVLKAFADLKDGGVELHFVCGNHDLWAGRFLRDHLGFIIHPEPVTLDFGGQRVLFVHGDGLNPRDWVYRMYKSVARAPWVIALFRLLHPDWAMPLGRWVSCCSRRLFGSDDLSRGSEVASLQDFARRALGEGRAEVVMCGHSHHPVLEAYPAPGGTGLYINVGDWLYRQSYVEWDGDRFRLMLFRPDPEVIACSEARCSHQRT